MKNFFKTVVCLFFCCCLYKPGVARSLDKQDTIVNDTILVTNLVSSDSAITKFIKHNQIADHTADQLSRFYKKRNYQYAWLNEDGLAEHTQAFWNLYEQYQRYSGDTTINNLKLQEQLDLTRGGENSAYSVEEMEMLEFKFTSFFLNFLKRAYAGTIDPDELQWHIPKKKLNVVELLDELTYTDKQDLGNWLPVSAPYVAMKKKVLQFKTLQQGDWQDISLDSLKILKRGDTSHVIRDIKSRLAVLGDLEYVDTTSAYNEQFVNAVLSFQRRHGLADDGIIGPDFLAAINIPLETKIKQMLINMERMRWMPEHGAGKRVVVNIPEFRLHVYQGDRTVLSMDVVVGKSTNKTVIFSDWIKHVVFSPYWNLPQSIVRNEILPGLEQNPAYLDHHRMEITGERNGLPVVRQKPGPNNALGRVKFIFPNKYIIYLHDTPAKQLFERTERTFSHGCIRLGDPFALAANLLANIPEWSNVKIKDAMAAETELWVKLKKPVPVYITYFTSWVDASGKLNFRKDIYGHDERLASHLIIP